MASPYLSEVQLSNFKAFERFQMRFSGDAYLVGPNNAGKSTLISAIRSAAQMLRLASNKAPDRAVRDGDRSFLGYTLAGDRVGLIEDNLRYEFHNVETRLRVKFSSGALITAVWPKDGQNDPGAADDEDDEDVAPFFYVDVPDGRQPRRPKEVRDAFPSVGVIPTLSPVEQSESVLSDAYVRQSAETRLASRHFRNHLLMLMAEDSETHGNEFEAFLAFCQPWIPELNLGAVERRAVPGEGYQLDLFFREPGRNALKEIVWAGDGIQVWLQLLLHLFRQRTSQIVILDEPDLYLHADLQRRLVRVLEETESQIVTATHSPEMLAEASAESIVWVDKSRRSAVRAPRDEALTGLADAIGSQFNVRLAKALRSRTVLFVEGKDMKVLTSLSRTAGAPKLAGELGVAVVPLEGFTNWEHVEPFKWLVDKFLARSVNVFVVLDRDFRPQSAVTDVLTRLAAIDIDAHVWARKELESYLLLPEALARVSKAPPAFIRAALEKIVAGMHGLIFARALDEELRRSVRAQNHRVSVTEKFQKVFDASWKDNQFRLEVAPAKEVFHALNRELVDAGHVPVTARALARATRANEITEEMTSLLLRVEATL